MWNAPGTAAKEKCNTLEGGVKRLVKISGSLSGAVQDRLACKVNYKLGFGGQGCVS